MTEKVAFSYTDYPEVILACGEWLYGGGSDPRFRLDKLLSKVGQHQLPVRKGTHHFQVIYRLSPTDNSGPNHSYQDLTVGPVPQLGVIDMAGPPPDFTSITGTGGHVETLLQEIGHAWLVYHSDIRFLADGQVVAPDLKDWFENNQGVPYSGPLLVGRQCMHWGSYFQADGSPIDGLVFQIQNQEDGFDHWSCQGTGQMEVTYPGGDTRQLTTGPYNDLDLVMMGALEKENAYQSTGGSFSWIEPRLVAPQSYRAGLFLAFQFALINQENPRLSLDNDFYYFGFSNDHRRLAVERSDGSVLGEVMLGSDYHPLGNQNTGVALRAVRRGDSYDFQYRYDNATYPLVSSPSELGGQYDYSSVPGLFEGVDPQVTSQLGAQPFRTVATVRDSREPLEIGILVATYAPKPCFVEAVFFDLETYTRPLTLQEILRQEEIARLTGIPFVNRSGSHVYPFATVPPAYQWGKALQPGEPVLHERARGPKVWSDRSRLHIRLPIEIPTHAEPTIVDTHCFNCEADCTPPLPRDEDAPPYNHGPRVDMAPRVGLQPPAGDFAFGSSVRIQHTLYQRSSGGFETDVHIWGRARSLPAKSLIITTPMSHRQVSGPYNIAYFIVAQQRSDITQQAIAHVERVRRYVSQAFHQATQGRRGLRSGLIWPKPGIIEVDVPS